MVILTSPCKLYADGSYNLYSVLILSQMANIIVVNWKWSVKSEDSQLSEENTDPLILPVNGYKIVL